MLQVFYGNDEIKVRQEAHNFLLEVSLPGSDVVRIEAESYISGQLLTLASSVSLFSATGIYLLDTPSLHPEFFEELLNNLEVVANSPHQFILLESSLLANDKKNIAKFANGCFEYKAEAEKEFNVFKLAEALSVKDKRTLWILLQEAKHQGRATEEIIGTLWWQLKTMRIASLTKDATEAGIKDYPYKKAKSALRTFPAEQVADKSRQLLTLYHKGHWGLLDMDLALEQWVLGL